MTDIKQTTTLPASVLRWHCDADCFPFASTLEVEGLTGVLAQPTAAEALEFGLLSVAKGQNVYVRGPRGTGRMTMVRQATKRVRREANPRPDRAYVHNFSRPDQPRLLSLPAGQGRLFRRQMQTLAEFIRDQLPKALDAEPLTAERIAIQQRMQARVNHITAPLEHDLRGAGMKLVTMEQGPITQTLLFPLVDGEPVPPARLRELVHDGKVPKQRLEQFEASLPEFQKRVQAVTSEIMEVQREGFEALQRINEQATRELLEGLASPLRGTFAHESVAAFLDEVISDVIETRLKPSPTLPDPLERYGVNVVHAQTQDGAPPVVEECNPSLSNLLGTIEFRWTPHGPAPSDYSGIRTGALLRADGGYLVLDVDDLLFEPGAWRALMRTLRSGQLEIVPPELGWLRPQGLLNPEPIDIQVRVVLVGDALTYYRLDALDPDFGELFKVLADFDHEIERDEQGTRHYASVIAAVCREERLLPFDRSGVAALTEHGARIASRAKKLTARFGRLADIAREAAFLAGRERAKFANGEHVREAVRRTKHRASLPSRKFQELIETGTIRVQTQGMVVGQINGLAVMHSGPITYGFPARVTATIGAGQAGIINIEGRAQMSGAIHTKGFHILGGLLRHLLRAEHPLAFDASIAFEQSYGGIDGDSASGPEICCLLSALTGAALDQSLAMTGAIDQHGHIQPVGGVNEKIEGFYDTCNHFGLTGHQGVIIPAANAGDLMLRPDVVEACAGGRFHVYAVESVHEALEILTGVPAGEITDGAYPPETLLGQAVAQAREYWRKSVQSPATPDS